MIVTINSTATLLTFTQEQLDNAYPLTMVLSREYGCNSTVLPISTSGIAISDNTIVINLTRMYGNDTTKFKFDDGVYKFTLTFAYPSGSPGIDNSVSSTSCFVVDYDLKCKLLNDNDSSKLDLYKTMFFADDCDTCNCSHLCTIYNHLIENNTTDGTKDCGCN